MSLLAPPPYRHTEKLVRDAFRATFEVLALRVPVHHIGRINKDFKAHLLNQPRLRNIVNDTPTGSAESPGSPSTTNAPTHYKLVLLNHAFRAFEDLPESFQSYVRDQAYPVQHHTLTLDYNYWPTDQIIRAILPSHLEETAPASFETVGHIAHMNLRDEYLPYRHIIGQVILDKTQHIETVVNKLDSIDTTFRFFKMEVLAGKDDMLAQVKENDCRFRFDFSKVYWNSRLHHEHERIVHKFVPGDYICDVFAGVGPFALPAAKQGGYVYANDLNPESFKWLQENIRTNKLDHQIQAFNMDGRAFIRHAFDQLRQTHGAGFKPYVKPSHRSTRKAATASEPNAPKPTKFTTFQHVVMNLPATAIEFLDALKGLYSGHQAEIARDQVQMPLVHVHCFTRSDDPTQDLTERISQVLDFPLDANLPSTQFHFVRKVAPNKDMYCVTFQLPTEVAFKSLKRKADTANE
ncbi:tRNA(m(1)G37)methyltransferase [Dimargaris xerosporica]|nr:tRNA(m(1)G37)methyltransferase [Dimargaris xerosporica]